MRTYVGCAFLYTFLALATPAKADPDHFCSKGCSSTPVGVVFVEQVISAGGEALFPYTGPNRASFHQAGSNNELSVSQVGRSNVFIANQIGSNSKIVGEQNARNNAGNFAGITQEADGNEVIFSQNGGNGILVNQSRNGASVEVRANGDVVSPAGLAITINQR